MSPADFWRLHPSHFWALVKANQPVRMYGSMTENEVAEIYNETYGADR